MKTFDVQAVEIERAPADVFAFVSDPANLPRWARAFRAADAERARLETPAGSVEIGLRTLADADGGVVDWELTFPDGAVALAQSRVTRTTRGTTIYSFVLHAPPVPLAEIEGALAQQIRTLREELASLKAVLEK
jgi:hypothetical protein